MQDIDVIISDMSTKPDGMEKADFSDPYRYGRELATEPELIFLDEPTASLDPILTSEVLKAVKELKSEGRNFIFVTHEISFLKDFADYIVFFKDAKICEHGDVSCLQSPKTRELYDFLNI